MPDWLSKIVARSELNAAAPDLLRLLREARHYVCITAEECEDEEGADAKVTLSRIDELLNKLGVTAR